MTTMYYSRLQIKKTIFVLLTYFVWVVPTACGKDLISKSPADASLIPKSPADASLISKSPADAKVYFIEPNNGQTVSQTFKVKFGLIGMGVAPAGVNRENTGHHHILIDLKKLPDMNKPLPFTDSIRHFGRGETETELSLSTGKHTLQLLLGNYLHIPHDKPIMSEKITITVN